MPIAADRRPLLALLAASVVSLIGNSLVAVAIPWFVLQTTGSPAQAGLVGFAQTLPHVFAGMFGGVLVDRFGYTAMSVISDLVSGVSVAIIPLLHYTIGLAFWQLLLLVFIGAILDIPGMTARRSMLPEIAMLGNVPLARANAWFESAQHVSFLIGPPIAGVLIAAVGAAAVLWIDAATFLISIVLVMTSVPRIAPTVRRVTGRYRDEVLAGLRFIRRDPVLLWMAVTVGISNCVVAPLIAVILPVFVKETSDRPSDLGLLIAAGSVGALIGALLYGSVGLRLSRRTVYVAGYLTYPLAFWGLALMPPFWWLMAIAMVSFIAIGPLNPLMVTVRHERSPIELRGRVFSSFSAIAMVAQPLGVLVGGLLIEGTGLRPTVLGIAIASQALGIVVAFMPVFKGLEVPVDDPALKTPG